ncbi:hypothetical protein CVS40_5585 [Lucilia cuprina]|nr:hypothetical protein CVS40_5585 [Lucilia cuprina]
MVRLQYFYSLSVGASGAGASYRKLIVIKIIMEDEISGYCVMVSYNSRNWMGQETTYNHYFLYHLFHYFRLLYRFLLFFPAHRPSSNTQVTENKDLQQKPLLMQRAAKTNAHVSDYG